MAEKSYRGVSWNRLFNKWVSMVRQNGVTYNCGMHVEQKDAVKARDMAIIRNGLKVPLQVLKPAKK